MTKVSIVTVCYNAVNDLPGTLDSIKVQSHADIDHLVIDGGSTDGSLDLLLSEAPHATIVSQRDRGIFDAMNKGIGLARGDVIVFMNAGDHFFSRYSVELAAEFLDNHPKIDVIYGGIETRGRNGQNGSFMPDTDQDDLEFLVTRSLPHQATFAQRGAFAVTGLFDWRRRSHGDYEWFLRVAADARLRMQKIPVFLASFELGGRSGSDVERGERERHAIQNAFPVYRRPEWMARRILAYQEQYIGMRIAAERA